MPGSDDEGEIVGVARYAREGDTDGADAALTKDRFQGKGLGVELTRLLVQAAGRGASGTCTPS